MARKKLEERNIRKIKKANSGSYIVTIPIEFIRELNWKGKQKVIFELDKKRERIIIKDWKK